METRLATRHLGTHSVPPALPESLGRPVSA